MCGRFALALSLAELTQALPGFSFPPQFAPRYNIAPSQPVLVIPNDGRRQATFFEWGFVPSWGQGRAGFRPLINARSETAPSKPTFRAAFRYRRCLIPASGFYEWQQSGSGRKQPWYFHAANGEPLALAGLWESWQDESGGLHTSFAILTTRANPDVAPVHGRMPVILPPVAWENWLQTGATPTAQLLPWLRPAPAGSLQGRPVSLAVNNPRYDHPDCLLPAAAGR